jgi:hypothetical protein
MNESQIIGSLLTLKIWEWGQRTKKVTKPLRETNGNPKCHMHIPNLRKAFMYWTSSSKPSWKKEKMKEMDLKKTPKTLMPLTKV